jgi:SNF2 family DNA or RNA helicase
VVQGYTDQIRETYVLRRTKEGVAKFNARLELPKCEFENIELEMGPKEKALYEEAFNRGQDVVREVVSLGAGAGRQMEVLEALLRVRQVMTWPQLYLDGMALKDGSDPILWSWGSKKMDTLMELIESHPKEKALVFTQFMGEMDHIQERLTAVSIPVFRIDGSVLKEKREEAIAGFKAAKQGAVFLIQIKAGGVGLNLQEATRVYITTPAWNTATELQAIGRAHRTGQTQRVVVKRLVYVGYDGVQPLPSVEQSIMQLQEGKAKVCAEVLNDPTLATQVPNATKTKITIHALRKIFRV